MIWLWETSSQLVIPETGITVTAELKKTRMTTIGTKNAVKFTTIMISAALLRFHIAYVRTRNISSAHMMMVVPANKLNEK